MAGGELEDLEVSVQNRLVVFAVVTHSRTRSHEVPSVATTTPPSVVHMTPNSDRQPADRCSDTFEMQGRPIIVEPRTNDRRLAAYRVTDCAGGDQWPTRGAVTAPETGEQFVDLYGVSLRPRRESSRPATMTSHENRATSGARSMRVDRPVEWH